MVLRDSKGKRRKSSAASEAPKAVFLEAHFEFGEAMSGAVVERDFVVKNEGSAPLLIQKIAMTTPLDGASGSYGGLFAIYALEQRPAP